MDSISKLDKHIDDSRESMIALQTVMTAIPAIDPDSGGIGEENKAKELTCQLEKMGLGPVMEFRAPDSRVPCGYRPNLLIRRPGKDSSATVWIMSHLDVVPEGDLSRWKSDPFTVRHEDGILYGRGVEDNQQGMVASIFAMKALVDEKIVPAHDIGCIFVADEETGSKFGIQYLLNEHPHLFGTNDYFLVPDSGEPLGRMIEVAEKSILWLKVTTHGKQCHASRPYKGNNAFYAASRLVTQIRELYKVYPQSDTLFDPPISTFEPTKKEANVPNINTIPGQDIFYIDCRVMPGIPLNEVIAWIKARAAEIAAEEEVDFEFDLVQKEQAAEPTPSDSPVVKALAEAIKQVNKVEPVPMGIGGGTVAAYFRQQGFHAAVWSTVDESAHQPNEYCKVANLVGDTKVFARLLATL